MKVFLRNSVSAAGVILLGMGLGYVQMAVAQNSATQARVVEAVQSDKMVALRGNVHPMARPANDRGVLQDQQPVTRIHVLLKRSAEQESTLQQLMADQLDAKSPRFHQWLTPQEFGAQFGPADSDVQAVKNWLSAQGFTRLKVNNGKTLIEFDGTAGQVRNAFRTEVHRLSVKGEEHFANMQEPQIPAALAPVVKGVVGLHNFHPKSQMHRVGKFKRNATTGEVSPLFTFSDVNGTFYGMGPGDFAKIYNTTAAAVDGSGVSIAIVAQSNINLQDVTDFRNIFGLTPFTYTLNSPCVASPCLEVITNGADPGLVSGDEGESDLDVEWSGAVAPGANIIFVTTQFTDSDGFGGVNSSAEYIVDNNVAPVMSYSYGACESAIGTGGNAFYNSLWQQAAAEGITVVVSAGDNGSAGCDDPNSETSAVSGIGISGVASTPYNVAMGGTDFNQTNQLSKYWAATNGAGEESAQSYIPEMVWNDSCASTATAGNLAVCANATASSTTDPLNIVAGSGGPSAVYSKPSWQSTSISGMPNDGARDIPDLSLFSADGANKSFLIVCESDADIAGDTGCNLTTFSPTSPFHDFQAVGGTSAAAPSFAGIMAMINKKTGARQGNANVALYALALAKSATFASCDSGNTAAPSTCIFHDITSNTSSDSNKPTQNNSVACTGGSPNCSKATSGGFGVIASGTSPAFLAGTGYDLATGLGSVNVTNLINNWSAVGLTATTITLSSSPTPITGTVGAVVTLSGTVAKTGTATPTGVVVFENAATGLPAGNDPVINIPINNLATDPAALNSSGAFSVSTAFLPAGTYTLKAHYGGDSTYAQSDSTPISVNLTKQPGAVIVSFVDANGNITTANQNVAYGSSYILRVDVGKTGGTTCQAASGSLDFICPTGTVSEFDQLNGAAAAPLKDFPNAQTPNATNVANLNNRGFIEDQPIQLGGGTHAITATYAPDAASSYSVPTPNVSNTLNIVITPATTTAAVVPSTTVVASGGSITLTATISSGSNSAQGPTGTVQFLSGASNLGAAANCTPAGAVFDSTGNMTTGASCTAVLTTTISSLPPGFYTPAPRTTPFVIVTWFSAVLAAIGMLLALRMAEPKRRYAYAGLALMLIAAAAIAGCGGSSSACTTCGGSTRSLTAKYSGDTNYAASTSPAKVITVN